MRSTGIVRKAIVISASIFLNINIILASGGFISGYVFLDKNENGLMDSGEPGVAGVVVSNQLEVALTDAAGKYSLPIRDKMIVFVTKPSGYQVRVDHNNLPQFYYIHQPSGSPSGLKYPGILPTGSLPERVNFPLYKVEEPQEFSALIVGDIQCRDSVELGYYRDDFFEDFLESDASFMLTLGDNAYDDLSLYESYIRSLSLLDKPVYHVLGNHDINYDVEDDSLSTETFQRYFGPPSYSFNYGRVHFIILDDVEYLGQDTVTMQSGGYKGGVTVEMLQWIENDLKYIPENHLLVFAMHIPLYTSYSDNSSVNVVNRTKLFEILRDRNHLLTISGHMHFIENLKFNKTTGWMGKAPFYSVNAGAACGAWWSGPKDVRGIPASYCMDGTPNGYFTFTFNENNFIHEFHPAPGEPNPQMRIFSPPSILNNAAKDTTRIMVNIYNADPDVQVYCRIDNQEPLKMQRTLSEDLFMVKYLNENKDDFPGWLTRPANTTHIWKASFPEKLSFGYHTIRITAKDWKGIYKGIHIFEYRK